MFTTTDFGAVFFWPKRDVYNKDLGGEYPKSPRNLVHLFVFCRNGASAAKMLKSGFGNLESYPRNPVIFSDDDWGVQLPPKRIGSITILRR